METIIAILNYLTFVLGRILITPFIIPCFILGMEINAKGYEECK